MKNTENPDFEDDMKPEYDFSHMEGGVQGKYAERFKKGSNIIRLEPDVAEVFDNDVSVNEALRSLIKIVRSQTKPTPH